MNEEKVGTLIVGAGISGLSAADELGDRCLILERETEPGGYCRSVRRGGYIWDYAGHFFHFQNAEQEAFFQTMISPDALVCKEKCSKILYHGRRMDYPFQNNIHQLPKREMIDCLFDFFHREQRVDYGSFLDMLYGRFGRAITEKFLRPYNEKLYACPLTALDAGAMGRFFPQTDLPQLIDGMKRREDRSYNRWFFYPREGAGAFTDALAKRLEPGQLRLGAGLAALDPAGHRAVDTLGRAYRYKTLINTAPLNRFLPLVGTWAARKAAECLSWNKVLVWNLGFEKKSVFRREHWFYVPGGEARYYRVGFYDNVQDGERLSLYVEIAFPKEAVPDAGAELNAALDALRRHGIVQPDNPLRESCALLMDPAYVHVTRESEQAVQTVREELAHEDIFTIGRYGGWRYCSMEDCMLEARALARRLKALEKHVG